MKKNIILFIIAIILIGNLKIIAQTRQPNIIVVLCDDMGYGDAGFTGSKLNRTPNLDELARNGIQFTNCYAAANVCSPSRIALLTGRYPIRSGIVNVIHPPSTIGIRSSEVTMAQMLQDAGYYTGMIGKWHLGDTKEFLPLQHGFQEYFGLPNSNDMRPRVYLRGNDSEGGEVDLSQLTQTYTKETLRFIDKNKKKPFFLYLAQNMPHTPIAASDDFKGKSANGLYGDVVEELDWSIGQMMKKLRELKLEDNTLIVFTSDNGPWLIQGKNAGTAFPYFQGKFTTWEGGHREPTLAYWKGKIKPKVYNGICTLMDWYPTVASLTKAKMPTDRIIDGEDLSPVLFGDKKRKGQEFYFFGGERIRAYREGDYKLILPAPVFAGRGVFPDVPAHGVVLFNLASDPGETTDISASNPTIVAKMTAKINEFQNSVKDLPVQNDPFEGKKGLKRNQLKQKNEGQ